MNKNKNVHTTAVCRNGGFSAFLETFVLVESLGIFSNFSAEKPPLLQAAKRCKQFGKPYNKKTMTRSIKTL
jgi:hypothetical protein